MEITTNYTLATLRRALDDIAYSYSQGKPATNDELQQVSTAWLLLQHQCVTPEHKQLMIDRMNLVRSYALRTDENIMEKPVYESSK